jgi:Dehydrogenases with different specificities (related to short-chain alcohol dehydrogenases)
MANIFDGKVVLITGSSQGIGRAVALKFASLSAKIAFNDIAAQEENLKAAVEEAKKAAAPDAKYFMADVSKYDDVEKNDGRDPNRIRPFGCSDQ